MAAEGVGVAEAQDGGALDDSNKHFSGQPNGGCSGNKTSHSMDETVDTPTKWSRNDSSTSSKGSDSSSEVSLPGAPDGGWGWVVVLASFLVHLIADGCGFSFGVLYVELLAYFKESKGKTAWVGSLFVSVPLITGPIASAITNRYGCRKTTIVGGVVAAAGFVLSLFADSIEHLCFTFGIIAGFGLSLVYVPAVVIVAYYFEKRRAFATGVAVAGSGIGTFVFAPLTEYLMEQYSWKGAVLIIGGIMLNICACGAVFRPIFDEEEAQRAQKRAFSRILKKSSKRDYADRKDVLEPLDSRANFTRRSPHKLETDTLDGVTSPMMPSQPDDDLVVHSLLHFPTYLQKDISALPPELFKAITSGNRSLNDIMSDSDLMEKCYATQSLSDVTRSAEVSDPSQVGINNGIANGGVGSGPSASSAPQGSEKEKARARKELVWQKRRGNHQLRTQYLYDRLRPMYRKDIFYRGSLMRTGWDHPTGIRAASCPDIVMKSQETSSDDGKLFPLRCINFSREVRHIMRQMLDTSILRSIIFVYFSISSMLLYMWYDVPYVYSPAKATDMGISDGDASYLVSILGIVSTFGQIVIGYLGDRPGVRALHLYNVLTSIAGIATMLVPIIPSYIGLCVYAGVFGFFISGNYALTTIILVELLGMEKLTNAYGFVMLAEGIANLIGPPIAGAVKLNPGVLSGCIHKPCSGKTGFSQIVLQNRIGSRRVVNCWKFSKSACSAHSFFTVGTQNSREDLSVASCLSKKNVCFQALLLLLLRCL